MHAKIKVALGGRAAEEVVYGETSTGAESDIQQLTEIARQMVGRWGMSDDDRAGRRDPAGRGGAAPSRRRGGLAGDAEAGRRRGTAHRRGGAPRRSSRCSSENRSRLDSLVQALLEHETLDEDDAYAAAGVERTPTVATDTYAAAARSRKPSA